MRDRSHRDDRDPSLDLGDLEQDGLELDGIHRRRLDAPDVELDGIHRRRLDAPDVELDGIHRRRLDAPDVELDGIRRRRLDAPDEVLDGIHRRRLDAPDVELDGIRRRRRLDAPDVELDEIRRRRHRRRDLGEPCSRFRGALVRHRKKDPFLDRHDRYRTLSSVGPGQLLDREHLGLCFEHVRMCPTRRWLEILKAQLSFFTPLKV
jgi:hypothetical protein